MHKTDFHPLAANGADYPRAVVSLLAQPTWRAWRGPTSGAPSSVFIGQGESFTHSRYALGEAMRRAGVGAGGVVLLPSFHCRAIVEPVLFLGGEPQFYAVTSELRPDYAALLKLLQGEVKPIAMVLTHYFGFSNGAKEAHRFCEEHGIVLIEDCAHALYGGDDGHLFGSVGSYAVASLWKFLPVRDGAVLLDNSGRQQPRVAETRTVAAELKAAVGLIERGIRQRDIPGALPSLDVKALTAEAHRIADCGCSLMAENGLKEFNPAHANLSAWKVSQRLAATAAHGRVAQRRRAHYRRWLDAVHELPGVQPLFPMLPEQVVPYAFPLLVDTEGLVFHVLKLAGLSMWRWEDMAVTDCPIARDYRLRLLQLPCHQELNEQQMAWMINAVQKLVSAVLS